MSRWILHGFAIVLMVSSVPARSSAQQPTHVTYSGSSVLQVPARPLTGTITLSALAGRPWLGQGVPASAPIAGYQSVSYVWRLLSPREMPKNVWLCYHEHQDPQPCTERLTLSGSIGAVEASWHSGYTVVNGSTQEVLLEVKYAAWAEGPGGECR
jgi:hypothetical protein